MHKTVYDDICSTIASVDGSTYVDKLRSKLHRPHQDDANNDVVLNQVPSTGEHRWLLGKD
jgi:hypothetical protein